MTQSNDNPQAQRLTFTLGILPYGVDVLHVQAVATCMAIALTTNH